MSFYQFSEATEGWIDAHDTGDRGMSQAEQDEIWEWMQTQPKVPLTHKTNGAGHG